jgi:ankyrin repeat protein
MEILIAHGADVDRQCDGESGFSPLAAAALCEDLNACQILLAAGASPVLAVDLLTSATLTVREDIIKFIRNVAMTPLSVAHVRKSSQDAPVAETIMGVTPRSFLDMCYPIQLEILSGLEGSEVKTMQASCADLGRMCDGRQILSDLTAIEHRPSRPSLHANLHEALRLPHRLPPLSIKEAYNIAYIHACSLRCSMEDMLGATDPLGRTPLLLAVRTSNHEAMKLLLHMGAPVDKGNILNGWSPLLLASWKCDVAAMEMLIAHGADVDRQCHGVSRFSPLAAAALCEDLDACKNACKILLAAGASRCPALSSESIDILDLSSEGGYHHIYWY